MQVTLKYPNVLLSKVSEGSVPKEISGGAKSDTADEIFKGKDEDKNIKTRKVRTPTSEPKLVLCLLELSCSQGHKF